VKSQDLCERRQANKRIGDLEFQVGDWVYLNLTL